MNCLHQLIHIVCLTSVLIPFFEVQAQTTVDTDVREAVQDFAGHRLSVDEYTQYAPNVALWALQASGVKGESDLRKLMAVNITSAGLMALTVKGLKIVCDVERPDGSDFNSMPSGHTAKAFMGAELLRMEYAGKSPWIGVAGYAVAAGTGFMRVYNDRHWLSDVVCGAGIGFLSVKVAYLLYPHLAELVPALEKKNSIAFYPEVTEGGAAIAFIATF